METIQLTEYKHVRFIGDIHGNYRMLGWEICEMKHYSDTLVVVCGDVGFGFSSPAYYATEFTKMAKKMRRLRNHIVFMRGNHDDPSWYTSPPQEFDEFEFITIVPDYTVLQTSAGNILCIGGARSTDKHLRRQGYDWWDGERPTPYTDDLLNALPPISYVATHCAPSFALPCNDDRVTEHGEYDATLKEENEKDRRMLMELYCRLVELGHPLAAWCYGHYHKHNEMDFPYVVMTPYEMGFYPNDEKSAEGLVAEGERSVRFVGLDCMREHKVGDRHFSDWFTAV